MRKLKKWLMAFAMAAGVLSSAAMTVFANTGDAGQAETTAEEGAETVITEQASDSGQAGGDTQEENEESTSFSISGNGEVVDDETDDGTKEFLTIQTKNGNTFFLVLDRSSNTENVYMLSLIDENDLAEFVEDTQTEETAQVVIPETETAVIPEETETESTGQEESGGMNTGALLAIGVLAAGAIGAGYYFKVVKPKKEEAQENGEDLEFYDGGAYVREDPTEDEDPADEEHEEEG